MTVREGQTYRRNDRDVIVLTVPPVSWPVPRPCRVRDVATGREFNVLRTTLELYFELVEEST